MTESIGDKTLEIAKRTRKNLEFIYEAKNKGSDVEEFTQLLNSMLGMVISLREDYFRGDHITWAKVESLNLPSWNPKLIISGKMATPTSPKLQQINSFSQLITKLRHSFAHNCFELSVNETTRQITGITVWNIPSNQVNIQQNRVWEADITEHELKGLAFVFVEYLEKEIGFP